MRKTYPTTNRRWPRFAASAAVVAFCLYSPFAWLLFVASSWDYRLFWLKRWPILPGFVPGALFHPNEAIMFIAMGVTTVFLLVSLSLAGTRGRIGFACSVFVALLTSVPSAWLSYVAFRV